MSQLKIQLGDITKFKGDAIVNAANRQLVGGGGVDGAIHHAAGMKELNAACAKLHGCPTGEAKATAAFKLPVKYIIHTVGPIWRDGSFEEAKLLKSCYLNSIKLAQKLECHTLAFPSISTGVYHYPLTKAAQIAVKTIETNPIPMRVTMICFDQKTFQAYQNAQKLLNQQ